MINAGGQMFDEHNEENAKYGDTLYGWELERKIQDEGDISILMNCLDLKVL